MTPTLSHAVPTVGDQAQALRGLMQRFHSNHAEPAARSGAGRATAIAVTSGKGGVGKTNIALNLAIALARLDAAVCVIDANLGLGNIDLLCGLNGYWNLAHVVSGARNLRDVILSGPEGIEVIPGASGLTEAADWSPAAEADVFRQLEDYEETRDYLIIDAAVGIHHSVRAFLHACDQALIVTTPEPTSVADAYSTIKALCGAKIPSIDVIVNQCDSTQQARVVAERIHETARMFLHVDVGFAGFVPKDPNVAAAVARRKPFLIDHPNSPASTSVCQLALRLQRRHETQPRRPPFFPRMQPLRRAFT
jgi:flagellar biosynthesis protein FlhG